MTSQVINTTINSVEEIADNVRLYTLSSADNQVLPSFSAGAHIDLLLDNGMVRQYSLCNQPESPHYQVAVQYEQEGRGGSAYIHQSLSAGDALKINAPRNHFKLDNQAENYLLLAGGIGITPIMLMAFELLAQGKSFQLYYLCRERSQAAFADLLTEKLGDRVHFCFSQDTDSQRLDIPNLLAQQPENTQVYTCGSERLLQSILTAAENQPGIQVHFERFSAAPQNEAIENQGFEIELASTGQVLQVEPDQSILQVLQSEGVQIETMCKEGLCGSCEVNLLEGEADHRDSVLTDGEKAEQSVLMACCSRAHSERLVLDL